MKRFVIAAAMTLWVVSLAAISFADTLVMRDGTRLQGTVTGVTPQAITFRHADGVSCRYSTSQIQRLEILSAGRANRARMTTSALSARRAARVHRVLPRGREN